VFPTTYSPPTLSGYLNERSTLSYLAVMPLYGIFLILQWSFGITCWEIFSGGKAPYPGVDPLSLVQLLETGQRLNKPVNSACPDEMWAYDSSYISGECSCSLN